MFKEWKFGTAFALELMLPWFVLICGNPAIYWFSASSRAYREQYNGEKYKMASAMFDSCYEVAMATGWIAVVLEVLIGLVGLVLLIIALVKKPKAEYSVCRPLAMWLCSAPCAVGTLALMFFVLVFTYGMGV